jgi:DNA polymerase/3'-5' exonuclease PolX
MSIYSEMITASINKALRKRLLNEARGVSKNEAANLFSNVAFTKKRRHAEDMILARELGVKVEDLK